MDRNVVHEFARMILFAAVIALAFNLLRTMILGAGISVFMTRLMNNEQNQNQTQTRVQTQNTVRQNNDIPSEEVHRNNASINSDVYETVNIPLESPMCFNFMSRNDVFQLRQRAIRTSPIFSNMDYVPSREVFRIVDGKPWISIDGALHFSKNNMTQRINGPSRESIGILNPELLYYISVAELNDDIKDGTYAPIYKEFDFIPYNVSYNPQTNTITAYIKNERYPTTNRYLYEPINLADTNAHDLGYKYAFMSESNNVEEYEQYKDNSLKKDIKEITGWYMCGPACGVEGGCNNYAPYWQYYNDLYINDLPASFTIKLWKERPRNTDQTADINFRMVFE